MRCGRPGVLPHEVHATQVTSWKHDVLEKLVGIFGGESSSRDEKKRIHELHAKIGELTVERDSSCNLLSYAHQPHHTIYGDRSQSRRQEWSLSPKYALRTMYPNIPRSD